MHLYYALAFAVGVLLPIQTAINSDLRTQLGGSVMLATMISFAVGALTMALLALGSGERGGLQALPQLHWWQLTGGVLGAAIVAGSILLAPRIGLAGMGALIVAGQLCASLLLDRQGFLGLAERAITMPRLLGVLLVLAGVLLVNYGDRLRS
ncbi:DMT family transporter [Solimonas sp. K1W22B-7]|uniref:DMT family transporter n=1 Tax=Solimonas sp. K1W22B-7 TaxID=2303331 RepID=UPI000E336952|nr:DMT family transporter [Solimonas sp. K1W22B-7]AXQ27991.1 DMT family transporter [Solimonas sp. K1W22B-7]